MPTLRLRDRDAIVTREGLIFRVFGYSHPPNAFVCDLEYAPSQLFVSKNPKALRTNSQHNFFYKFYEDEGWKFLKSSFPSYLIFHESLQGRTMGVSRDDISEARKPDEALRQLIAEESSDELIAALKEALRRVTTCSGLSTTDFGVFGSILHCFHHPKLSDIDLVIYGRAKTIQLRKTLQQLYEDRDSQFANEFDTDQAIRGKHWRFKNLSPQEFVWHQQRKLIYGVFKDAESRRAIKTEFEPVRDWSEIRNDYNTKARVVQKGWIKMTASVLDDFEGLFIPSAYRVKPEKVLDGAKEAHSVDRIVSYVEEFRMQVQKGETAYVEGNLEEVISNSGTYYQVVLTYCPRYYEQVLKSMNPI